MKDSKILLTALAGLALTATSVNAATLTSSTFTAVGLNSVGEQTVDTTGANVVDWGYYGFQDQFLDGIANTKAVSGIGAVTVTGTSGIVDYGTGNPDNIPDERLEFTFDDGTSPTASTVSAGAGFGGWAEDENGAATFTFNDLGVGTHTVRLYVGHTSTDRILDIDYAVTATDGILSGNTASNSITSGDLYATYEIVFTTTDASADLALTLNSTSGSGGSGIVGGYVVETVPEPGSLALLGLGGLLIGARRRRG